MPKLFWKWIGLAAAIVALDQLAKIVVLNTFRLGESIEITGFFNLVFVYNTGAAFSFLASAGGWQRWFFVVLALGISVWIISMLRQHANERRLSFALALILGGAIGNVVDRIAYGAVVDFLDFHVAGWHWPAFNVADSAICVGAVLMVLDQFFQPTPAPVDSPRPAKKPS